MHGVVWDVSDRDLATLDSAEGVPVRYRRDRLTVHTGDGPADAWVYIDHRVETGAPRPGYLERIIDGALHHGLPHRWIEFLRRWDPSHWPRPLTVEILWATDHFRQLLGQPGVVEESRLRSRFGFLAIHGGGLEQMTDVIAERAADAADASVYVVRHPDRYPHHLPSARYPRRRVRNGSRSSSTTSTWRCRCTATAGSGAAPSCWRAAATANWPLTSAGTSCCPAITSITDLDAIPPRTARHASGQPGQPGPRRRRPARVVAAGPRHQPAQPAAGDDGLSPVTSALVHGLAAAARTWEMSSI